MEQHGFRGRWGYKAGALDGRLFGMSDAALRRLLGSADAILNLTGSTHLREEHLSVPVRIYLETDPVLPQLEVNLGHAPTIALLDAHTHHFTYGENFGSPDCGVPIDRYCYQPTRPPIVLDWWCQSSSPSRTQATDVSRSFTTVANWKQTGKDIEWNGETYRWSKHHEFLKFMDLPRRCGGRFDLALSSITDADVQMLNAHGWGVLDAVSVSSDRLGYRDFIAGSYGEFSVAKDQNIRLRSGWFSDRSASYLAAGRPVIAQDTAFGNVLPTGSGLLMFSSLDEAAAAVESVCSDYALHSRRSREIAEAYFEAGRVVSSILQRAGLQG
jgi:hypothetical protein